MKLYENVVRSLRLIIGLTCVHTHTYMYVRMHKEGKNRISAEYRLIDTRLFLIRNVVLASSTFSSVNKRINSPVKRGKAS